MTEISKCGKIIQNAYERGFKMKKFKYLALLLIISCLCCACENNTPSIVESNVTEDSIVVTSEADSADNVIDGFKKAVYEDYNYQGSGQDKKGEMIYIEGTVTGYLAQSDLVGVLLVDMDGNRWMVLIALRPFYSLEKSKQLMGKEVRIFGEFRGFSETHEMPFLGTYKNDIKIQSISNEDEMLYISDFKAERNEFVDNPNEILYSEYTDANKASTEATSTGIVESVAKNISYWLNVYQKTEGGYELQQINFEEMYFDDAQNLLQLSAGDGVKFYYYINAENEVVPIAFDKVEVDFTLEDVEEEYKSNCKVYTYEEVARNPESVKGETAQVTGEVIQVVESYAYTYLRVNITKNKYGNYEDTIYVIYKPKSETEDRILEDDIVTIYGKLNGTETYTSVLGSSITLPCIVGEYIEIDGK